MIDVGGTILYGCGTLLSMAFSALGVFHTWDQISRVASRKKLLEAECAYLPTYVESDKAIPGLAHSGYTTIQEHQHEALLSIDFPRRAFDEPYRVEALSHLMLAIYLKRSGVLVARKHAHRLEEITRALVKHDRLFFTSEIDYIVFYGLGAVYLVLDMGTIKGGLPSRNKTLYINLDTYNNERTKELVLLGLYALGTAVSVGCVYEMTLGWIRFFEK